jgi:hypothetical protein
MNKMREMCEWIYCGIIISTLSLVCVTRDREVKEFVSNTERSEGNGAMRL